MIDGSYYAQYFEDSPELGLMVKVMLEKKVPNLIVIHTLTYDRPPMLTADVYIYDFQGRLTDGSIMTAAEYLERYGRLMSVDKRINVSGNIDLVKQAGLEGAVIEKGAQFIYELSDAVQYITQQK